jgi:hypothetical protein
MLVWKEAKRLTFELVRDVPCYEAEVGGGRYRVAPVVYARGRSNIPIVGYEAFFIPRNAKSAADVRDIAEYLNSVDEAKTAAQADYLRELARGRGTYRDFMRQRLAAHARAKHAAAERLRELGMRR